MHNLWEAYIVPFLFRLWLNSVEIIKAADGGSAKCVAGLHNTVRFTGNDSLPGFLLLAHCFLPHFPWPWFILCFFPLLILSLYSSVFPFLPSLLPSSVLVRLRQTLQCKGRDNVTKNKAGVVWVWPEERRSAEGCRETAGGHGPGMAGMRFVSTTRLAR